MSKTPLTVSQVVMTEPQLLTREQKFSGGFVANVHPDNINLMRRAARNLKCAITEGAPRRTTGSTAYIGIYTDIQLHDPHALLQEFFTLLVARSNERRTRKGANHETTNPHPTQSPRRRPHSVKAAPRSAV